MENSFIYQIAKDFKAYHSKVLRVENADGFLYRKDIIKSLSEYGVFLNTGTNLDLRISYELRNNDEYCILLSKDANDYLPDILKNSSVLNWSLVNYFPFLHIPTLKEQSIEVLNVLYQNEVIIPQNSSQTKRLILDVLDNDRNPNDEQRINQSIQIIEDTLNDNPINWNVISRECGKIISLALEMGNPATYRVLIDKINDKFQEDLEVNYNALKNSSAVKKPKIVSKILDYLSFNFKEQKIALLVVDGLAYWQYQLIKNKLRKETKEETIHSWLPSITQLSRQAIFRGSNPVVNYRQGPVNEEKLWKNYWIDKGIPSHQVAYFHSNALKREPINFSKLAIVYKELDDKMHSSDDYKDLYDLTMNWIQKTSLFNDIDCLLENNYKIFLTTDHGNIEAKPWRALQFKEKLGTNKSGSRSERHIEYAENWLLDELFTNNEELKGYMVKDENAIYFKNKLSFSSKETLVTHGGAHFLEVLIPFIEIIKNEK